MKSCNNSAASERLLQQYIANISLSRYGTVLEACRQVFDEIPYFVTLANLTHDDLKLPRTGDHVATAPAKQL